MNGPARPTLAAVVLDSSDARALAEFYGKLLDWEIKWDEPGWVMLKNPEGGPGLSFAGESTYVRPIWPSTAGEQQMMSHLDIRVADLDETGRQAVAAGAVLADFQPQDDVRVYFDPAGHPFCLFID